MSALLALAAVELRRFLRDRSNIFFVFVFPIVLVLMIGLQFSDEAQESQVVVTAPDSPLRDRLVSAMEGDDIRVSFAGEADGKQQVARGRADAAVLVTDVAARAFDDGGDVAIELVVGNQTSASLTSQRVHASVRRVSTLDEQESALVEAGVDPSDVDRLLDEAQDSVDAIEVSVVDLDEVTQEFEGAGQFDTGAGQQLLLFTFLASLSGSATLINARSLGVVHRSLSAPVGTGKVIAGQALGRFAIALLQGAYIMFGTSLLFGVQWGDLALSLLVLALFCTVSAAAAMVIGSTMDNESAASGVGVGVGLVVAGLGGCMMPLEFFSDSLRAISRITPHSWAYRSFAELQRRDGTFTDIAPYLGALAVMALVLLALGSVALRRSMSRPI